MSRPRRTHCKRGHPFSEANTYVRPNGKRQCRTCRRWDVRRSAMRRRLRRLLVAVPTKH